MTNDEHIAARQADADEDMAALGEALHKAYLLARRLESRGVDMRALGLRAALFRDLREMAEDAYTMGKGKVRT